MRLRRLAILTIFIIILASTLTITLLKTDSINKTTGFVAYHTYYKHKIIKVDEFETFAQISNSTAWNMETNRLNFGKMKKGDSSARFVYVVNDEDQDLIINIKAEGEMKDWLSYPKEFELLKDSAKEIHIGARAPGLPKGNYTGKLSVIYLKK